MRSFLIFLGLLVWAVPAVAIDGTELLRQVDRNLNPECIGGQAARRENGESPAV